MTLMAFVIIKNRSHATSVFPLFKFGDSDLQYVLKFEYLNHILQVTSMITTIYEEKFILC